MIPSRTLKKAIAWIRSRIERGKLYREYPELRHLDQAEREARRRHAPVEPIRAARKAFMTSALKEGR